MPVNGSIPYVKFKGSIQARVCGNSQEQGNRWLAFGNLTTGVGKPALNKNRKFIIWEVWNAGGVAGTDSPTEAQWKLHYREREAYGTNSLTESHNRNSDNGEVLRSEWR